MNNKFTITISRQFGSGGREIGEALAKELGIKYYDKELISLAAKESGISPEIFESIDEQATNSLLYSLSLGLYSFGNNFNATGGLPINDKLYLLQHRIIKDLANEAPCVIVGRCADYVLRDRADVVNIYIYADMEYRVKRVKEVKGVSDAKVEQAIKRTDKSRSNYYNFYSGQKWGLAENYDLCINITNRTTEQVVQLIKSYLQIIG